jgi:hypothetical protein
LGIEDPVEVAIFVTGMLHGKVLVTKEEEGHDIEKCILKYKRHYSKQRRGLGPTKEEMCDSMVV